MAISRNIAGHCCGRFDMASMQCPVHDYGFLQREQGMANAMQIQASGMAAAQRQIGAAAAFAGQSALGLGGLFGQGLAQQGAADNRLPVQPSAAMRTYKMTHPTPPKTLRQELQSETDDWLKDAL